MPREIELTKGFKTLVDDDDYKFLMSTGWSWCYSTNKSTGYAMRKDGNTTMYLHRILMNNPKGVVDHINQNTLDNRKCNLRVVDKSTNALNNQAKGVTILPNGKYRMQLSVMGEYFNKVFNTYEEARECYLKMKGKHAR